MVGIKAGQESQADGTDKTGDDGQDTKGLLAARGVGDQATLVTEEPLGQEGGVEKKGRQDAAGYEERLELGCAYVGDEGDGDGEPENDKEDSVKLDSEIGSGSDVKVG